MSSMGEHFGYGQQTPTDTSSEFNVMAFIIKQRMAQLETTKLVKVVAVHGGGIGGPRPTVDVLPLVSQVDGFNNAVPHGTVYGLPVFRLQGGSCAIVLDPRVDDVGFVVVADRDISNAKADPGEQVTPGSNRKFDLADGIFVGGILNDAPTTYVHIATDGITMVSPTKIRLQAPTIEIAASQLVDIEVPPSGVGLTMHANVGIFGNLGITGTLGVSGIVTFLQSLNVTGAITAASITVTGAVTAASATINGALTAFTGAFSGAVTAASGAFTGAVTAASATLTGALSAVSASLSAGISAVNGTFTGLMASTSAAITNTITATDVLAAGSVKSDNGAHSLGTHTHLVTSGPGAGGGTGGPIG